ncbi:MAG: enoyl-CoA hydratase/isomerase family protein [Gemmatimonadales bacterium]|jgi:enoyl-CoA hydratase|nr:MAG: enoyl-CoA hydratase/isomerase family protein [Gemmatimonadales bacterium]
MSDAPVRVEIRDDGIAVITLDRQDKLNALNEEVRQRLMDAVDALSEDDRVRVAVLHGAGDKAFVAGADISEFAARTANEQRQVYLRRRVYDALAAFPKPIIAAVHGYCLGGGSELALACDVRVADATARFSQAEIRIGLIPGAGGTQRLARLVGPGQALRIALTGEMIDAEEAWRIGLVEFLVEEGQHLDKALEVAARMARWSPVSLRLIKQSVQAAMETPLSAGLELEKELFLAAFGSEDGQEGVKAFTEKRKPDFKGR